MTRPRTCGVAAAAAPLLLAALLAAAPSGARACTMGALPPGRQTPLVESLPYRRARRGSRLAVKYADARLDDALDCSWRVLAAQRAQEVVPTMSAQQLRDVLDATEIEARGCNVSAALEGAARRLAARDATQAARDAERLASILFSASAADASSQYSDENRALRATHAGGLDASGRPPPHAQRRRATRPLDAEGRDASEERAPSRRRLQPTPSMPDLFVDWARGDDANPGSLDRPFKTILAAFTFSQGRPFPSFQTIYLRGGMHFVPTTVTVGPDDSDLAFIAFPGERPVVSGGVPVNVSWQKSSAAPGSWEALGFTVPGLAAGAPAPALSVGGHRATLARFPNRNPERCFDVDNGCNGLGTWIFGDANGAATGTWVCSDEASTGMPFNTNATPGGTTFSYAFPPAQRDAARGMYVNYTMGYGGNARRYTMPNDGRAMGNSSFWASSDFQPTDRWLEMRTRSPRGINYTSGDDGSSVLPHAPYADLSQLVAHVFRGWFTWMFTVSNQTSGAAGDRFLFFGGGGHQGGEGSDFGNDWHVEGVVEELDAQNEFIHDVAGQWLLMIPNASDASPVDGSPPGELVVPVNSVLFLLYGAQEFPVANVSFDGITFTQTRPTFMDAHSVPSGGDWAIERSGAIMLEGTVDSAILRCNFTRLDGNAVLVQNFNRFASVAESEFSWLGGSAVVSWGWAQDYDGTGNPTGRGQHPRYTSVAGNIVREIGLIQKQSSGYTQFLTALANVSNNVMYNMPRAAVNCEWPRR